MGDIAQIALSQRLFLTGVLQANEVLETLQMLPKISGAQAVDRKVQLLTGLLSKSLPKETKFIIRTVLGDLRTGFREDRMKDAISNAFAVPAEAVEHAYSLLLDYGKVANLAAKGGTPALENISVSVGHPIRPMLAQQSGKITEVVARLGKAAYEIKLDGIRCQVHKSENNIRLFSRGLEDYTRMFPDIVRAVRESVVSKQTVLDGELVAMDTKKGRPYPFQEVLKRRRKYDIQKVATEFPVTLYLFDILLIDGRTVIREPYSTRRDILEKIVTKSKKVRVVEQKVLECTKDIFAFQNNAITEGHEGLIAKALDSPYKPGKREFRWLKLKPILETLDLVVVGVFAGSGKRANLFGSYLLATLDPATKRFKTVTSVGSGISDKQLADFTNMFNSIVCENKSPNVDSEIVPFHWVTPQVVMEIAFEEIQKSADSKHTSGYGLRFPRVVRVRHDKNTEDVSTIEYIKHLYETMRKTSKINI